jgi:hypothetical protein
MAILLATSEDSVSLLRYLGLYDISLLAAALVLQPQDL